MKIKRSFENSKCKCCRSDEFKKFIAALEMKDKINSPSASV